MQREVDVGVIVRRSVEALALCATREKRVAEREREESNGFMNSFLSFVFARSFHSQNKTRKTEEGIETLSSRAPKQKKGRARFVASSSQGKRWPRRSPLLPRGSSRRTRGLKRQPSSKTILPQAALTCITIGESPTPLTTSASTPLRSSMRCSRPVR